MRPSLTEKQKKLFDYLKQTIRETGSAPSLRAAAARLDISHAAVAQTLKTLEEKNYLQRQGKYSRTLHIFDDAGETDPGPGQKRIPVVGRITAGLPIYASQEWEDSILVDAGIYPGQHLFALRVQGHSMKNAGIHDQDIAICRPRQYAQNKEIVVALVHNEEATVKRFFLHPDFVELRPENPDFKSQTYKFDEILIQGKVIGILRTPQGMDQE
ncbi:MAG: transcriptional repressor LexA [Proteobacteria bacterium]|nr:transcriptional repressor LexA [Desulfobacula sp.]MBU3952687.1 transcriptional repressor LexA [Pseudomonadota bacterium]MBU4130535.1 transcriptional repressor LexA [Pseudomonadota bacterium]